MFPDSKEQASKTVSPGHSTEDEGGPSYTLDGTLLHLHVLLQERASHINTFIYVKIPQTTLCITYKVNCVTYTCMYTYHITVPKVLDKSMFIEKIELYFNVHIHICHDV